jgi:hypothetical protein
VVPKDLLEGHSVDRKADHLVDLKGVRLVDRRVDHLEDLKVDHSVDLRVDHLEDLKVDHLEDLKVDHSVDLKVDHSVDLRVDHLEGPMEDLMEVQKGQVVTKVASLPSERLGVFEPVQVVQLVVKEEAMEQAQIVPAQVEFGPTNQRQAGQQVRLQQALKGVDLEMER